ncbi:hypothetical protein B2J93_3715 [Marssonina coronariae]|uniref:Uncharacterized protein n=1 Tax=Diplocarpon coronariae TaxID=2795749 RepID=A0A218YXY3_9HELO|nr:hypothetical protein B2J93_3715 [Marssonina coronariae]
MRARIEKFRRLDCSPRQTSLHVHVRVPVPVHVLTESTGNSPARASTKTHKPPSLTPDPFVALLSSLLDSPPHPSPPPPPPPRRRRQLNTLGSPLPFAKPFFEPKRQWTATPATPAHNNHYTQEHSLAQLYMYGRDAWHHYSHGPRQPAYSRRLESPRTRKRDEVIYHTTVVDGEAEGISNSRAADQDPQAALRVPDSEQGHPASRGHFHSNSTTVTALGNH